MKRLIVSLLLVTLWTATLNADNNNSAKENNESNNSSKIQISDKNNESSKVKRVEEEIKKQLQREEKYAKEQAFYQGDDYDLESHEVDPDSLSDVPFLEPNYEEMTYCED